MTDRSIVLPEPVVREMIRVTASAAEQLRYAGKFYDDNTVSLRLMLEMLMAGASSISSVSSIQDVLALLDAKTITQNQYDDAKAWLCLPDQHVPTRTFNQMMTTLGRKVVKSG